MTVLIGDVKDVGLTATRGTVTVRSAFTRRAREATGVITRETSVYELQAGRFRTKDLDPGRIVIELNAPGVFETWEFDLPNSRREVALADVLQNVEEYSPEVVTAARAAAAQAEASAQKASGFESGAERARDEAVQAQASVSRVVESAVTVVRGEFTDLTDRAESAAVRAESARDAAASSAEEAKESASGASASAERAESAARGAAVNAANQARGELQGFAQAASVSEQNARSSADAAKADAGQAAESKRAAGVSASAAEADRIRAESAAVRAGEAQAAASQSQSAAAVSAESAGTAQKASESARDEAVQAAASAKVGAPDEGWPRDSLSQEVRDSLDRADRAQTDLPKANKMLPGVIRLAGDLAGTWDDVKVPGLAGKMDKQTVSASVIGDALVQRTPGGQVKTATPQADDDAATKSYVDSAERKYVLVSTLDYQPTPYKAVQRTSTGTIRAGDAVGPADAVTKKQLDALAARVAALENNAVTSTTYRAIASGTGSRSDTIYIQE